MLHSAVLIKEKDRYNSLLTSYIKRFNKSFFVMLFDIEFSILGTLSVFVLLSLKFSRNAKKINFTFLLCCCVEIEVEVLKGGSKHAW